MSQETSQIFKEIREYIASDELETALIRMRTLLASDPKLHEALQQSGRFYNIRRDLRLGLVDHKDARLTQNQIRFGLLELLQEVEHENVVALPASLTEDIITDRTRWLQSLQREFLKHGVSMSNRPTDIIQHFGWLIEAFLLKMQTAEGQQPTPRAFSYLTETWQSSLRYLCHIQLAQLLNTGQSRPHPAIADFIAMRNTKGSTGENSGDLTRESHYDYLNLLLVCTDLLQDKPVFVPQITDFVCELTNTESELFETALFLDQQRRQLLAGTIPVDTASLSQCMDEYRTALVYWLRKIAFLVRYRLVSIKEVSLNYRLGTAQQFIHLYGELHGVYDQLSSEGEDYNLISVDGVFTYSQSVLLFKGNTVQECLQNIGTQDTYLSLSPLLIDQSVFSEKTTQTPEIYYYTGQTPGLRQFTYAQYKNEVPLDAQPLVSNKTLHVKSENSAQPKLNDLYEQLEMVFKAFKP